jgi:hypothetical protein
MGRSRRPRPNLPEGKGSGHRVTWQATATQERCEGSAEWPLPAGGVPGARRVLAETAKKRQNGQYRVWIGGIPPARDFPQSKEFPRHADNGFPP